MRKVPSRLLQCNMRAISCCKLDACSYLHILLILVGLTDCMSVCWIDKLYGAESFLKSLNRSLFFKNSYILWNPKAFYFIHNSMLLASTLNQMTLESVSVQPVS